MLGALNSEPQSSAGTPSVVETGNDPTSSQAAKPAESGAGRIKGWKERLDLMRKQKAAQIEESRITANDTSDQKTKETNSDANNTLTDIFAPASGL